MRLKRTSASLIALALILAAGPIRGQVFPQSQDDPVLKKILELGAKDNRVMTWLDTITNRFGGRYTGSDAYNNAATWAVWQFKQWGLEAALDEAGELPVGFNRGPWSGKMIKPVEKALYFGTPSMTAGTHGVQRGPVAMAPEKEDQVEAVKDKIKGAWILVPGESNGIARDGRRSVQPSPLTKKLIEAGALGTIQLSKEPIRALEGGVQSWNDLPVLPDIRLTEAQYNEIKGYLEKGGPVELEFEIRNWFKTGPVKYHNVVAWIPGTTNPEEIIVLGGHFDSYDGSTGAVDNGSGSMLAMEALRILSAAGARPKRTIMAVLFASEEQGLVGSQAWLKHNADKEPRILVMFNRDSTPAAIVGATVPNSWYADMAKVSGPLVGLNPKFPFDLRKSDYPSIKPERPSGTDSSAFAMEGIPTLSMATRSEYNYGRAWHTLLDTYNEVVPYGDYLQHSALVYAVLSYGIANLDQALPRQDYYLPDGLYADISTSSGRIIAGLDYKNAPIHAAQFIRIIEGPSGQPPAGPQMKPPAQPAPAPTPQAKPPAQDKPAAQPPAAPAERGGGPGGQRGGGPGGQRASGLPIGRVTAVSSSVINAAIVSEIQKSVPTVALPAESNPAVKHDAPGVLGMNGPNLLYLTLAKAPSFDGRYSALGKVVAGKDVLAKLKPNDIIQMVRIVRSGPDAREFKTDPESFKKLLEKKK